MVTIGGVSGGAEWRPQPGARRTLNIPPQSCEVTPGVSKGEGVILRDTHFKCLHFIPVLCSHSWSEQGGRGDIE